MIPEDGPNCFIVLRRTNLALPAKRKFTRNGITNDLYQWRIQDFPEMRAPTLGGGGHTMLPKFPKNCMKLKEFGPGGVRPKFYYVDPPLHTFISFNRTHE